VIVSGVGHSRFLPNPFQFNVHQLYQSTQYIWRRMAASLPCDTEQSCPCDRPWRLPHLDSCLIGVGRSLPPGRFLVLISVRGWVDPRGYSAAGWIKSIEKFNDLIGIRSRDLPACSIVSLPRSPYDTEQTVKFYAEEYYRQTYDVCVFLFFPD
jgi:hypothetical protein